MAKQGPGAAAGNSNGKADEPLVLAETGPGTGPAGNPRRSTSAGGRRTVTVLLKDETQIEKLTKLSQELNEGDMHGISGANFFKKFNDRWLRYKNRALETQYWEEWWTPVRVWWNFLLVFYAFAIAGLTLNDITTQPDIWKTRAAGRIGGIILMAIFAAVGSKLEANKRRLVLFLVVVYFFQVPCILTDDERLIKGMQKFDRMGGAFKQIADAYNIAEVEDRAFCRSMLPFVVAQLSLWTNFLRFSYLMALQLFLITAFTYLWSSVWCEVRIFQDNLGVGMEMMVMGWIGLTLLWATKRNETLTRYHFLRFLYNSRSEAYQKMMAKAGQSIEARPSISGGSNGGVAPPARPITAEGANGDAEVGVDGKRPSGANSFGLNTGHLEVEHLTLWMQIKHSMMMSHEIGMFHANVDSATNEFNDQSAEKAFKAGSWLAVQYWIRITGWLLTVGHFFLSLKDAAAGVTAFLITRVALRIPIFCSFLYYRVKTPKLEAVKDKRQVLFYVIMIYFVSCTLHNDEIVYTWVGAKHLATECYGMLPFLTAQMAWMMVAIRPPLAQVRLLLVWVALVYFVTGAIFDITTFHEVNFTVFEMMSMLGAVLTFTASSARGEMLARNHFMIEFIARQAQEGKFGKEAQSAANEVQSASNEQRERRMSIEQGLAPEGKLNESAGGEAEVRRASQTSGGSAMDPELAKAAQEHLQQMKKDSAAEIEEKKGLTAKELGIFCAFVLLMMAFAYAANKGILQDMALAAAEMGPAGHIIFIILYIFVAMPFGYGYSVVIVSGGFAFGWAGLISGEIGTALGVTLCYFSTKYLLASWVERKMKTFKKKTQRVLLSIELAIKSGKGSIGMQMGLRVNPVLPFGWTNAILGVWKIPFPVFICSSMLGTQVDLMMKTNVGVILQTVGSISAESTPETKSVIQTQLIINSTVLLITLTAGCAYSRWIMKNVMPQEMDGEKEEIEEDKKIAETVGI